MISSNTQLSLWQRKQAALLYHFASLGYLKSVKERIDGLLSYSTSTLDKAEAENRDAALQSARWGQRNTALNWGNNAWSFLADFQQSLAGDIANRAIDVFAITSQNYCARGLAEYSMGWTTPDEQVDFDRLFNEATHRAYNIDLTMNKLSAETSWCDFTLAMVWQEWSNMFTQLPKFRVRKDLAAENGAVPVRTGVYISADDPNATLQFAWSGGCRGKLQESSTFNGLGKAALAALGRADLWFSQQAMLEFVKANLRNPSIQSDSFFDISLNKAKLAPSLVARHSFTSRPCRWYYVELVHGEFEEIEALQEDFVPPQPSTRRFDAGSRCTTAGYYFTPSKTDSRRYFGAGDMFPDEQSTYGTTIWQFDSRQGK